MKTNSKDAGNVHHPDLSQFGAESFVQASAVDGESDKIYRIRSVTSDKVNGAVNPPKESDFLSNITDIHLFLALLYGNLYSSDLKGKADLVAFIDDIIMNDKGNEFREDKKMPLVAMMYQLGLKKELLDLKKIPEFEELVLKIIFVDCKQGNILFGDIN